MVRVILIHLDFPQDFQKCIILGVLSEKCSSRSSPYLEEIFDILEVPEVPEGIPMVRVIFIQLDFTQSFQ